jgi:tetratricopeptide (TPR) repeat protein/tRNA A-37 threonylcarbamoyl transferase component Bud32
MIGKTVSHYRILEPLGEGGMGTVYLAEDTLLGRRVAIKFPSLDSDSHDYRARFLREARAASELSHSAIATLFDYGETEEGRPFLVMELARGRPLTELMQQGELNLQRAVAIVIEIATALIEAHARGVIHRDIKPSNIMIDDDGQVKVLDFGLAKQLNKEYVGSAAPEARTLLSTETRSGVVLGTPAYLSPEQATGAAVDGRSDLFALGTLLYEAITGRTPFGGNSFIEIAANVLHVDPPPPSKYNRAIPRALDFIVLKALAKKPNKRYQSARELIADLTAVKDGLEETAGRTLIRRTSPSLVSGTGRTLGNLSQMLQRPRVPISYLLIGGAILLVAGVAAFRFWRPAPHVPPPAALRWYEVGTNAFRDGAYFQASQALDRAIAADDDYILAHARLAEALVELDYADKAKDELLRVNAANQATLSELDALTVAAITATARHDFSRAVDLYGQIVKLVPEAEKAYALVDQGRAFENNNDAKSAIQSYQQASERNPQYATAYLRLGILYGQQGQLAAALSAFDQAESIYQALGRLEGRSEVIFQRGALLNKRNKLSEAKAQLEQALALANATDNKSQIIKTLLQLSSVAFDNGETARSTEYAQQAVDLAQRNGMENLSAQALVDLGNAFLVSGKLARAENYLSQALAAAERAKARRTEARARVSLAGLQVDPDETVRYLEPALAFYQQGGYRSETFSCLVLLARAKLQKGDHAEALKSHEQLLQLAEQSNDQTLIALAHAERGSALVREEKFTEALDHLETARAIYAALGVQRSICNNLLTRADALWQLGRYQEASELVEQASTIANKPGGELKRLAVESQLVLAEMALSQDHLPDARSLAAKVMVAAGDEFKSAALRAQLVLVAADPRSIGAAEALATAKLLHDPSQVAQAQLGLAVASLAAGDPRSAADNGRQAAETFAHLDQLASSWAALLVAAEATQKLGDKSAAREYAMQARDTLFQLEQRWGSQGFNGYLRRPDIQKLRKQLDQLTAGA